VSLRIGFHISTAGGLQNVPERAWKRGCSALQLFTQAPSQWKKRDITADQIDRFRDGMRRLDIRPWFIHAIYLLNLATSVEELYLKSIKHLADELVTASQIEAAGVIFHLGSAGREGERQLGIFRVADALVKARELSRSSVPLILENSAGSGGMIGSSFADIASIMEAAQAAEPLRICFDTAHAFGSGMPIHERDGFDSVMREMDSRIGISRLALVHFNDSHEPFNSKKDRHWHIGCGLIGRVALRRIVNDERLRQIPFIMETPGDERDDRYNMLQTRRLIAPSLRPALPPFRKRALLN